MSEVPFVQIFTCGGTLDKIYFDAKSEFKVGEPQIEEVFRRAGVTFEHAITSLMRKDSLDMTADDRELIRAQVKQSPHRYFLITHGTDTMSDTARCLMGLPDKVIVLTGSMTPARFQSSDAEFNIGCAVGVLLSKGPGIYVAMNGRVFAGDHVRKNREAGRFEPTP